MTPRNPQIVLNAAPTRHDRALPALAPDYAQPDPRTLADVLAYAPHFGRLIHFYNLQDQPEGDWADLFANDLLMIVAAIDAFPLDDRERRFIRLGRRLLRAHHRTRKHPLLLLRQQQLRALLDQLQRWLDALALDPDHETARTLLRELDPEALTHPSHNPQPHWHRDHYDEASRNLDHAFARAARMVRRWQALTHLQLPTLLQQPGRPPHIALYAAFCALFASAQANLNDASVRIAHLYRTQILREPPRGPVQDSLYLAFTAGPKPIAPPPVVAAGTLFPAGVDPEGLPIQFATTRDTAVAPTTLAAVQTIHVLPEPLFQTQGQPITPQTVQTSILPVQNGKLTPTPATPAQMGFTLASAALLLTSGNRRIQIEFTYDTTTLAARLARLSELCGTPSVSLFQSILEAAFTVSVTTAAAWLPVETYTITLQDPAHAFTLAFELPPTAPPLGAPAPDPPAMQAIFRQQPLTLTGPTGTIEIYPLSLLTGIAITTATVTVSVEGLDGLTVENSDGRADPTKPWTAFGAVPRPGGYTELTHPELTGKTLTNVSLHCTWFGLPQQPEGFAGYYRDYLLGPDGTPATGLFDNQSFQATLLLRDAQQQPLDPTARVFLFRSPGAPAGPPLPNGTLTPDTLLTLPDTLAPYTSASRLRLQLTAPTYGFGESLYAPNVLYAVLPLTSAKGRPAQSPQPQPAPILVSHQTLAEAATNIAAIRSDLLQRLGTGPLHWIKTAAVFTQHLPGLRTDTGSRQELALIQPALTQAVTGLVDRARTALQHHLATLPALSPQLQNTLTARVEAARQIDSAKAALTAVRAAAATTPSPSPWADQAGVLLSAAANLQYALAFCQGVTGHKLRSTALDALSACHDRLAIAPQTTPPPPASTPLPPPAGEPVLRYPNPPYVPMLQGVTLSYTARDEAPALNAFGPFPHVTTQPALLPAFESSLVLAFAGLPSDTPSTLTLLLHPAPTVPWTWQYLDRDRWHPLPVTGGPALLTLSLPQPSAPGLAWLRALTPDPHILGIYPNAVEAVRVPGSGRALADPLPARAIQAFAKPVPGVAAVQQPQASFNGTPPEQPAQLQLRLGERLRHKDRAILPWDYERLALEQFPFLDRAVILPTRPANTPGRIPGELRLVVLPHPAAPSLPPETLAQIQAALQRRAAPFVQLSVLNPTFVRVTVHASFVLVPDADPAAVLALLDATLIQALDHIHGSGLPDIEARLRHLLQTQPDVDAVATLHFHYDPHLQTLEQYFLLSAPSHDLQLAT